ncbi:probable caffeoyl-CoA O-methyltransferase 2 [Pollicipes pollicipes]|uniref:probable caffeoyl-CoA O-methyltransferase 2 n=1 Tax=Pollicipes pollicipes TaxID=41117 RepID=UPI0018850A9F|nr:probable caffeoyl-CoA O-methyltransferase 2 [Pollicipes pollicipes]
MSVIKEHSKDAGPLQRYLAEHMTPLNPHLVKLRAASLHDVDHAMLSASDQMNFLQLLLKTLGAKKTLDVGVFTGYSALATALVLPPDGKVTACDVTDKWLNKYGRPVWREAGVENKIDLRIAPATETLQALINGGEAGTFDYAFIDADKTNYLNYYELTLQLLRVGGILVADNALRGARVLGDEDAMDENTRTIHEMNKRASSDPRVHASLLNLGDGVLFCRRVK